jgi:type I restriction enzyme S subunit
MIDEDDLPSGWKVMKINDVINEAVNGGTPKRSNPEYWDGEIPWLSSSEVRGKYTTNNPDEYITKKGLDESSANIWPKGTVLVAMYGRGTIGRPSITNTNISGNQAICGLVPDTEIILEDYLYYWLENIREILASKGRGATASQQNLNQSIITDTEVPVPSLEVQRSIVRLIEEQLNTVSDLEHMLSAMDTGLNEYEDSLLVFSLLGENDYTSGIVTNLRDESNIPSSWELLTIEEISEEIRTGGTPKKSNPELWGGDLPWRGSKHFNKKSLELSDTQQFLTESGEEQSRVAKKDDVLIVCRGAHTGKVALVRNETAFNQDIKVVRCGNAIEPKFLAYCLTSLSDYFDAIKRGGTTKGIVTSDLSELEIPVPPIEEQIDIIGEFEAKKEEIDKCRENIAAVEDMLEEYRNSVLYHAFCGDLLNPQINRDTVTRGVEDSMESQYSLSQYEGENK